MFVNIIPASPRPMRSTWRTKTAGPREQTNTPLLRCHPDRLTITSTNRAISENASRTFK